MSFSFILFLRKITSTNVSYENYVPWYDRFAQVVIEGKALPTKHKPDYRCRSKGTRNNCYVSQQKTLNSH